VFADGEQRLLAGSPRHADDARIFAAAPVPTVIVVVVGFSVVATFSPENRRGRGGQAV